MTRGVAAWEVCRKLEITKRTHYRCHRDYGSGEAGASEARTPTGEGELTVEETTRGQRVASVDSEGSFGRKLLSAARLREVEEQEHQQLGVSERRACRALAGPTQ